MSPAILGVDVRSSKQAAIIIQTLSHGPDGDFHWDEPIDLARSLRISGGDFHSPISRAPCQITVNGGVVTATREVCVP